MTSQNIISRLDITGLTAVTGTSIMQVTQTAYPASDKGFIIETQDSALGTPVVPNPNVVLEGVTPVEWVRYIWKRVPFDNTGILKHYSWNPLLTSDPTYLLWQWIESDAAAALALAQTALTTANTALLNASTALTAATTAQSAANTAQTTANTANTTANTAISTANAALADVTTLTGTVNTLQSQVTSIGNSLTGLINRTSRVPLASWYLREQYTSGTNGADSVASTWVKRLFTHIELDSSGFAGYVTLNGDSTITLVAGIWSISGSFPCGGGITGAVSQYHKTKIVDNTNPADLIFGSSEITDTTAAATKSELNNYVQLTVETTIEIQHQGSQNATNAFGIAASMGPEIYGQLKLSYLGSV